MPETEQRDKSEKEVCVFEEIMAVEFSKINDWNQKKKNRYKKLENTKRDK